MTKLSNKRVKFAIKRLSGGDANPRQIATLYEVSVRRVQQLARQYRQTGQIPMLSRSKRPMRPLSEEQKRLIDEAYEESRLSATLLRLHILKKHCINISHNKIHDYLKQKGWGKPDEKKQKQRKYCRYEREHSLSLGHMDWHERKDGGFVLPFIDDASRKILALGEFTSLNTENALKVLKQAVEHAHSYQGYIRELNSDRDTTFMTTKAPVWDKHAFQQALRTYGIKFVPSRARHPQTNGKNERWFQEYDKHRHRFETAEEFAKWYNDRVHGGLSRRQGITPNEAFMQKLPPEYLLGMFYQNIVGEKQ